MGSSALSVESPCTTWWLQPMRLLPGVPPSLPPIQTRDGALRNRLRPIRDGDLRLRIRGDGDRRWILPPVALGVPPQLTPSITLGEHRPNSNLLQVNGVRPPSPTNGVNRSPANGANRSLLVPGDRLSRPPLPFLPGELPRRNPRPLLPPHPLLLGDTPSTPSLWPVSMSPPRNPQPQPRPLLPQASP